MVELAIHGTGSGNPCRNDGGALALDSDILAVVVPGDSGGFFTIKCPL